MITCIETALVTDDDVLMREFIIETLRRKGINVTQAGNGLEAKKLLEEKEFDIAFIDLKMPGLDGMQLLKHIKDSGIPTLVVIITAFGTVELAVDAMKIGAYDFLMKPFSPEQVELILGRTKDLASLKAQNMYLQEELGWTLPAGRQMLGQSERFKKMQDSIRLVAESASTVLISGESGTGKELVAHAIHSLSDRRNKPFIRLNCAAVPDTLMDSELFGHEKGAFTGAQARRLGRFELADGGTLLLDEISEMKIGLQAKLLRVLQENEFERVGGCRTIKTDCRIIATTNRNLDERINQGSFRQDLFYRLNVVPIHLPPLRDRAADIPVLANAFLKKYRLGKNGNSVEMNFNDEAMALLKKYPWPGNVRELENLVERICVMERAPVLGPEILPEVIRTGLCRLAIGNSDRKQEDADPAETVLNLSDLERMTILKALELTGGSRQKTADKLGISVRTLRNKISEYRGDGDMALADGELQSA